MNIKHTGVNVNRILDMLDADVLNDFALKTNVDFHARKLKGRTILKLYLQGIFLYGNKLSQSGLRTFFNSEYFIDIINGIEGETITKAAISKRLRHINPEFFKLIYENAVKEWSPILSKYHKEVIPGMRLESVDSSMVAQTTKILSTGIHAGGREGGENGRKGVKYTLTYDGISSSYAVVHTLPKYADEDNALGEALLSMIKKDNVTKTSPIYVFDRGIKGGALLADFNIQGLRFVGRLNNNRRMDVLEDSIAPIGNMPSGMSLISDKKVRIYGRNSHTPLSPIFRVVKIDLGHEIGARSRGRRNKTETVLTLITDEMELSVEELMEIYRFRWCIEVFYKFLKQNLNFSHLISGSENGLTVILYLTLLAAVLLKTYCALNDCGPKLATTKIWLELGEGIYDYIINRTRHSSEINKYNHGYQVVT